MIQRAKGLRVPCVVQMRSLIGQQSNCLGIGSLCAAKEGSDHRRTHRQLRKINRPANLWRLKKVEEKHCFSLVLRLNEPEQPATKGGEIDWNFWKWSWSWPFWSPLWDLELVHNTRRSSLQLQHRWGNRSSTAYFQLGLFRPKSQVVFPAWLFFMTHKAWLTSSHLNVFRLSCANGTERGADFSCPYSRRSLSKASSLRISSLVRSRNAFRRDARQLRRLFAR